MEANSIKNQEIKREFVKVNVIANVTQIVEYIPKTSADHDEAPFSYDDLENLYYYEDSEGNTYSKNEKECLQEEVESELDALENQLEEPLEEQLRTAIESKIFGLRQRIELLEEAEERSSEVYEWWIVENWLGEKLKAHGETIIQNGMHTYWGRCTTGQAILLDSVITIVCEELEILEGQKYAWK
ncbi:hypothetical protein [Chitinophaga filiformis]|uniref:DUF4376 domain-containing protein n=1 Tax=Chitinophaga filiformis TaxID=104663 RepID=A0ABY4HX01_CHIFI|nr:hypothetical protein [Chitinophaga filiformis]UPK67935.1 hypothetical protein MYF79_23570 [Chitinophaga filiformis]